MGDFNFKSFADLSLIFSYRKGKPAARRVESPVTWHAIEGVNDQLPQSRFANLHDFAPVAKSRFLPADIYDHALLNAFTLGIAVNDNATTFESRYIARLFQDDLLLTRFNATAETSAKAEQIESRFVERLFSQDLLMVRFNAKAAAAPDAAVTEVDSRFVARLFQNDLLLTRFNAQSQSKAFGADAQIIEDMPSLASVFAEKVASVASSAPAPVAEVVSASAVEVQPAAEAPVPEVTEEAPKPRGTLRLKSKVEIPVMPTTISRRSSTTDLAAAFKTEMALLEKRSQQTEISADEFTGNEKRRHPLSNKSWGELMAEAEASAVTKKPKHDIDLANAFKAEMRAFQAEQEKAASTGIFSPLAEPLRNSFDSKTQPQSQPMAPLYRPRSVEKNRILAA